MSIKMRCLIALFGLALFAAIELASMAAPPPWAPAHGYRQKAQAGNPDENKDEGNKDRQDEKQPELENTQSDIAPSENLQPDEGQQSPSTAKATPDEKALTAPRAGAIPPARKSVAKSRKPYFVNFPGYVTKAGRSANTSELMVRGDNGKNYHLHSPYNATYQAGQRVRVTGTYVTHAVTVKAIRVY